MDLTEAVLRPVRGHHAFEACVEQLATAIRLGVYPTGSLLPAERDLAERLSVSRATLREAIAALRAAGMVETRRGRGGGTVVLFKPRRPRAGAKTAFKGRRDALLDSLTFREIVEPGAAGLAAARNLDDQTRTTLRDCLAAVSSATDPGVHRQCDSRLHLTIATASGSPLLVSAVTQVQSDLNEMLQAIPVLPVNIEHSSGQHEAIVHAILAGNSTRARRIMREHCEDTAALLRGLLD
jgi:GntR family transcriptional repressor for pyruvate dehydrogenase complex